MSTSYTTEPPTKGKVICLIVNQQCYCCPVGLLRSTKAHTHHLLSQVVLHTTFGPLDIELWPKEAPMVRAADPCRQQHLLLQIVRIRSGSQFQEW